MRAELRVPDESHRKDRRDDESKQGIGDRSDRIDASETAEHGRSDQTAKHELLVGEPAIERAAGEATGGHSAPESGGDEASD